MINKVCSSGPGRLRGSKLVSWLSNRGLQNITNLMFPKLDYCKRAGGTNLLSAS